MKLLMQERHLGGGHISHILPNICYRNRLRAMDKEGAITLSNCVTCARQEGDFIPMRLGEKVVRATALIQYRPSTAASPLKWKVASILCDHL